ncbi:unnamed protein product [Auanema sp. JU1783]|nr:unnamed protein product [Auanema sp. JU1783]
MSSRILRRPVISSLTDISRNYSPLPADPLARFQKISENCPEKPKFLITGSLGQLGRGLNTVFKYMYGNDSVLMSDIVKVPADAADVTNFQYIDILNQGAIEEAIVNHRIDTIIHFSALLSAVGEQNVPLALQVNCRGVENVLEAARKYRLKVFIPSTIGAFGPTTPRDNTPDLTIQVPTTIYGVSKVYAERLGEYYHSKFGLDFRCLRFPGIISATKPGGGTTDYAIQIFYDALEKGHFTCYLKPDTVLPMMYDTDCMASVAQFLSTPSEALPYRTYNVTGFSFTPEQIAAEIRKHIPHFEIDYKICPIRQAIADSWPRSLDDTGARRDWEWNVEYKLEETTQVMLALIQRDLNKQQTSMAASA